MIIRIRLFSIEGIVRARKERGAKPRISSIVTIMTTTTTKLVDNLPNVVTFIANPFQSKINFSTHTKLIQVRMDICKEYYRESIYYESYPVQSRL